MRKKVFPIPEYWAKFRILFVVVVVVVVLHGIAEPHINRSIAKVGELQLLNLHLTSSYIKAETNLSRQLTDNTRGV